MSKHPFLNGKRDPLTKKERTDILEWLKRNKVKRPQDYATPEERTKVQEAMRKAGLR